jgi:hypothetical protein
MHACGAIVCSGGARDADCGGVAACSQGAAASCEAAAGHAPSRASRKVERDTEGDRYRSVRETKGEMETRSEQENGRQRMKQRLKTEV